MQTCERCEILLVLPRRLIQFQECTTNEQLCSKRSCIHNSDISNNRNKCYRSKCNSNSTDSNSNIFMFMFMIMQLSWLSFWQVHACSSLLEGRLSGPTADWPQQPVTRG